MAKTKTQETDDPTVDRLIRVYLKMKLKRDEITESMKQELKDLDDKMSKVKSALLDHCNEHGVEGARTKSGLFYRTTTTKYWTSDWDAMGKFVLKHECPELLEKRLHQGNVKQFMEDNPDIQPPGLNVNSEYQISIRRK